MSQQFGVDQPTCQKVISGTQQAIQRIQELNQRLNGQVSATLPRASQSQAGARLLQRHEVWQTYSRNIQNELAMLNTDATNMLRELVQTSDESTAAAGR